jgi:hypothetical protein
VCCFLPHCDGECVENAVRTEHWCAAKGGSGGPARPLFFTINVSSVNATCAAMPIVCCVGMGWALWCAHVERVFFPFLVYRVRERDGERGPCAPWQRYVLALRVILQSHNVEPRCRRACTLSAPGLKFVARGQKRERGGGERPFFCVCVLFSTPW